MLRYPLLPFTTTFSIRKNILPDRLFIYLLSKQYLVRDWFRGYHCHLKAKRFCFPGSAVTSKPKGSAFPLWSLQVLLQVRPQSKDMLAVQGLSRPSRPPLSCVVASYEIVNDLITNSDYILTEISISKSLKSNIRLLTFIISLGYCCNTSICINSFSRTIVEDML